MKLPRLISLRIEGSRYPRLAAALASVASFVSRHMNERTEMRVTALLGGFLLVAFAHSMIGHYTTVSARVEVENLDPHRSVAIVDPATVPVRLRGTEADVESFNAAALVCRFVVSNDVARESLRLSPARLKGLGKLHFNSFGTNAVSVVYEEPFHLEASAAKVLALPALDGTPVSGQASVRLPEERRVSLLGTRERLESFQSSGILLPLSPVDVNGKTKSFTTTCSIIVPEDLGIVSVDPATIDVEVTIETLATNAVEAVGEILPAAAESPAPAPAAPVAPASSEASSTEVPTTEE